MKVFRFLTLVNLFMLIVGINAQAQMPKYVEFASDTDHVFMKAEMAPARPDLNKRYMRWCQIGEYINRQFTAQGATGKDLIQSAFKTTGDRVYDLAGLSETPYSIEVIVPKGNEQFLVPTLKQVIQAGLGVIAKWDIIKIRVGILRLDETKPLKMELSQENKSYFLPGSTKVEGVGQPSTMLATLLANSSLNMPVINETGLKGMYDFSLEWNKNDIGSLQESLSTLGLKLDFEQRPMKMVVVKSEPASEE